MTAAHILTAIAIVAVIAGAFWMMLKATRCPFCAAPARFQHTVGPHGQMACTICGGRYVVGEGEID